MPITINGSGTVTGLSVGGLPDGCVDSDTLATSVTRGKILQVKQATYATELSVDSTSMVTSNLKVDITPSATSSKILIMVDLANVRKNGHAESYGELALYRNTSDTFSTSNQVLRFSNGFGYHTPSGTDTLDIGSSSATALDSPSTTSQIWYTVGVRRIYAGGGYVKLHVNGATSTITAMEIAA